MAFPFSVEKTRIDYLILRLETYPQDGGTRPNSTILPRRLDEATEGGSMEDRYQSLAHSKWDCKYHIVFVPKRRVMSLQHADN
jgi:hypothetical protein